LFASQVTRGKSVIDIGCGVGYGSQCLAELGAASVHAFDLSGDAIRHAKIHYSHPKIHYEVGNAEEFSFESKFEVAVCFELIEHVRHPKKVLDKIKRALKPDGILIMSTPRALEQKRTDFHEHEFELDEYASLIREYFSTIDIYVENNHFSSLVTKACPGELRHIECLKDQFAPAMADVFMAVATSSQTPLPALEPVLALNDDAYVTMLERDVGILHNAEADFQRGIAARDKEIRRLEEEYNGLFERSEQLSKKLWEAEHQVSQLAGEAEHQLSELAGKDGEIKQLTAENQLLRTESDTLRNRLQEIEMKLAELEQEREKLRERVEWLTVRAADADARRLDAYEFARTASLEAQSLRRDREILRRDIAQALENPGVTQDAQYDARHRVIVEAMERLFLGTEATHHIAEDPLIDRVRNATTELNQRRSDMETLARELQALQEFQRHAEDWHRQLLKIRKSVSWRITAPLRAASRPFRGRKRK
jgi:protein-L-isoaspartate O-methyltransferase